MIPALRVPAFLLAGLVLFSACRRENPPQGELKLTVGSAPAAGAAEAEDQQPAPKVPLERGEILASALNFNLDLDSSEEQILVLRRQEQPEAPLRIAVADYDSVREAYTRSWEGATSATNPRLFELSVQDLVGDHNQEIVCRGVNAQGEMVLDVFRKTPSPTGLGLYFTEICQLAADGSIEIEEVHRPEGYRLGQKNGPSYPIHAYSRDKDSANLLDRIEYTYQWQYPQNRYVLTGELKVPGIVVQETQLRELFADPSVEHFEQYLAGPWLLSGSRGRQEIILFDPQARQISIFSEQVEEIFEWQTSFRSLSNRLYIVASNQSIAWVKKYISVEVVALNTIEFSMRGSEEWDRSGGRYLRLTDELQSDLLADRSSNSEPSGPELRGVYRSTEGAEIIFDPPRFTWIEPARQYSGGFAVFRLDREVLYLRGLDERGLPAGESAYLLDYEESSEGPVQIRRLTLTPARLGVHGAEAVSEKKLVFEQRQQQPTP
jgi:hypothetical protein